MSRHLQPVPDRPQRAVAYVRVSALMGRGGEDFHSPDLQVAAAKRAAAGMRVVEVVEDIDVSGTHFSRKGIDRIRGLVEAGAVDVVAIYDLSRLGRNVLESLQFIRWLKQRGVSVVSSVEQITDSPEGQLMLVNLLAIAEYRAGDIGRRWRQVIARRAERGQHHGRSATGYVRGDGGGLVPDPLHGPAMAATFVAYAAGESVREIRRRLQGVLGYSMASTTLKKMLTNVTYTGAVRLRGGVLVEAAHEPLVDPQTWGLVQQRVEAEKRIPPRLSSPRYSLSGLGRCAVCQGRTNIRLDHRRSTGPMMFCRRQRDGTRDCGGCGFPALAAVEEAVLEAVRKRIKYLKGNPAAHAAHLARAARAGADVDAMERELAATRRAMARTTERWAREQLDDRTYEDTIESLRVAERELAARIGQMRPVANVPPPTELVNLAERLLELWPAMDGGQRNRALRDVLTVVEIAPSARWRQPMGERVEVLWR